MPIVIVSGGCYSGRRELAERVARNLGAVCVDDDVLVERASAWGTPQRQLRAALPRAGGFLARFKGRRRAHLNQLRAALAEEALTRGVVYHGQAGPLLPAGVGRVLRVRLVAPLELRITRACEALKLGRTEALDLIRSTDRRDAKWLRSLEKAGWAAESSCDFVVHLDEVDLDGAANAIAAFALRRRFFDFDPHGEAALASLAMASRVKARLALNRLAPAPAPRLWPAWGVMALILCAVIGYSFLVQKAVSTAARALFPERARTFTGLITDTLCRGDHKDAQAGECVRTCVRLDNKVRYALYDGRRLYTLSDQTGPAAFAARRVEVSGVLDAKQRMIEVRAIRPI
ncbi:MAG: cytidylate kinase family protein [Acidobacteriota bacterium]